MATMRTLLFSPCAHFYDGRLSLDLPCEGGGRSGQLAHADLCRLAGMKTRHGKHSNMSPVVVFTGCSLELNHVFSHGFMAVGPKDGRREKRNLLTRQLSAVNRCAAAQAATLIGKCGFVSTPLQGRVLRFAERPLIDRQYAKSSDFSLSL